MFTVLEAANSRGKAPMKHTGKLTGSPLLPKEVETYWGQLTSSHIKLAQMICTGTEGLGELIDKGSLGHVFELPESSGQVVKITQEYDDGYTVWMEGFVLKNQDNPYVPQVSFYMRLKNGQSIILMERLVGFKDAPYTRNVQQQQDMLLTIAEELAQGKADEILEMDLPEGVFEILEFLMNYCADWMDVAEQNAMFRGETLVFTDPMV
ncbi:MAG: hypothetical protein OSB62_02355 [Alphaproteobacteria bacterium]|nr:hypothetical protein [Alphaproteobacteria bacterium]